ncbi:hypothetical protein Y1Q_0019576 [Alligator mississippiensis]|uniref:Uncharacterized protein n=1 Tax=Alligator mississippiensis TaxID=8496 RepID=A0A151P5K2_ALLMI|nr:hypothetical protein Y1Q_0019576 [Alligator mississippiensis]
MDRRLAPGSTNQDVTSLHDCLKIQSCRAFLPVHKWDQRNRQLEELEKARVRLHGLEKLGVLRRKVKSWDVALWSQGGDVSVCLGQVLEGSAVPGKAFFIPQKKVTSHLV